jgi:ligand-binding sensor domain-containing protein
MLSSKELANLVTCKLLRDQPLSPAKVQFAWRATVGIPMSRVTSVTLDEKGTLWVHTSNENWRRETARSTDFIKKKLTKLLGNNVVKKLIIKEPPLKKR